MQQIIKLTHALYQMQQTKKREGGKEMMFIFWESSQVLYILLHRQTRS